MKIIITEEQLDNIIHSDISEEYPESWNIEDFKKLTSFNARVKYCEEKLRRISSGSSRIVYKIDDQKVLKLAKNKKGIAQNNQEITWGSDWYYGEILANIFDYDENDLWVEMELARKVTPKKFEEIIGVPLREYEYYMTMKINEYQGKQTYRYFNLDPKYVEILDKNEFVSKLIDFIISSDSSLGDYGRLTSFGVVNRDGVDTLVVIDYGLNNEVYDTYYKRR